MQISKTKHQIQTYVRRVGGVRKTYAADPSNKTLQDYFNCDAATRSRPYLNAAVLAVRDAQSMQHIHFETF